jgi:hypothetical protein
MSGAVSVGGPTSRARASLVGIAAPVAIWFAAAVLAYAVGFRMEIPWIYWQLLDAGMLAAHPLASLCYLHAQPPGLNALAALVLAAARALDVAPETVAAAVFGLLGAVGAVAFHRLVRRLTGSVAIATVALAAVVADPAYHVFANLFFYEFVLSVLLVLLVAAAVRYVDRGATRSLVAVTLLLATISLTRTLFHPLWSVGIWGIVVMLRAVRAAPSRASVLATLAVLIVALVSWPAKNWLVYGRFFSASMTAYSVARGVPGCDDISIARTMTRDRTPRPDAATVVAAAARVCGTAGSALLTENLESVGGGANWNALPHLVMAPWRERCAADWIRSEPGEWLRRAAGQYAMWMRPAFVDPYLGGARWLPSPAYRAYARAWQEVLFADLRPAVERRWPGWFLHRYARVPVTGAVPYTLFGFVLFPLLLVALVVRAVRPSDLAGATALLLLVAILWPMTAACLTDGLEGNRMRFPTTPLVVIGVCLLVRPRTARPMGSRTGLDRAWGAPPRRLSAER